MPSTPMTGTARSVARRDERSADPKNFVSGKAVSRKLESGDPVSGYLSVNDGPPDYTVWSVEELRAFAAQLQLPDAARKSRRELLGIFDVTAR